MGETAVVVGKEVRSSALMSRLPGVSEVRTSRRRSALLLLIPLVR
jgi:hypothetical protein